MDLYEIDVNNMKKLKCLNSNNPNDDTVYCIVCVYCNKMVKYSSFKAHSKNKTHLLKKKKYYADNFNVDIDDENLLVLN